MTETQCECDLYLVMIKQYDNYQVNILKNDKKLVRKTAYFSEYSKPKDHNSAQKLQTQTKKQLF